MNCVLNENIEIIDENETPIEQYKTAPKLIIHKREDFLVNKPLKPFVKWAGGKGALLEDIRKYYPKNFGVKVKKYAEPFIGGGAVLFDVLSRYDIDEIYVSDSNKELINVYKAIQNNVDGLIRELRVLESEYIPMNSEYRKTYYYKKREDFNDYISGQITNDVYGAALFIFLNRTCFNGLYRVNRKGLFNVPTGRYKNPKICDTENLKAISKKLQNVKIVNDNYDTSYDFIDENTLVYFDPPYRPLTETSSFTAYSANGFDDDDQLSLADYYRKLDAKGAKLILSNSDPKNTDEEDDFFDEAYKGFNINRIKSKRRINSNASKRGNVNELLITNMNKVNDND